MAPNKTQATQSWSDTADFRLHTTSLPTATAADINAVTEGFRRSRWARDPQGVPVNRFEALYWELGRRLVPSIGWIHEEHYAQVAQLIKELTLNRSVESARQFLRSPQGEPWIDQYLVPTNSPRSVAMGERTVGEPVPMTPPTPVLPPSPLLSSPPMYKTEMSPLLPKEHGATRHAPTMYNPPGGIPAWSFAAAGVVIVVIVVGLGMLLPELWLSLG